MNDEYLDFIESDGWKIRRNQIILERGLNCEKCNKLCSKHELELHHLNYDHEFGTEKSEDLMLVCKECHRELEQNIVFFDNPTKKEICPNCNRKLEKGYCNTCKIKLEERISKNIGLI